MKTLPLQATVALPAVADLVLVGPMRASHRLLTALAALLLAQYAFSAPNNSSSEINSREALRLASGYMLCYVSGCGGVEQPVSRGDHWEVPLRVGIVGAREGAIHVQRHTGVMSYRWNGKSHPTITPAQLAEVENASSLADSKA